MDTSHSRPRPVSTTLFLLSFLVLIGIGSLQGRPSGAPSVNAAAMDRDGVYQLNTDQIIVKYASAVDLAAMSQAGQEQLLGRTSAAAGVELEFVRPMSGGAYVYRLPERTAAPEIEAMSRRLEAMPQISLAEADRILQAIGRQNAYLAVPHDVEMTPDDPFYDNQWHYRYTPGSEEGINLPQAWEITTGSSGTVVAVIDTGITDHVEFKGRTVPGYDFISSDWISNDGDGRDPDPSDPGDWDEYGGCGSRSSWHGTHVAGTIAASSNNGIGVAGVNWQAKILPIRVLGRCGGYSSDVLDGARWAAGLSVPGVPENENPADVLNLSLGGNGTCSAIEQAAYDDIDAAGKVVVVAAMNAGKDAANYSPASCSKVITVAATDRVGDKAGFSNYGSLIEISAPGSGRILSTFNSGKTAPEYDIYAYMAGTSMAAPHVAGVVSLLLGLNPGMTPLQAMAHIEITARAFPPGSSCNTNICGAGILDAGAAVGLPSKPLETPTLSDIANSDGDGRYEVEWSVVSDAEWYKVKEIHNDTTWEPVYEGPATVLQREIFAQGDYCYRVRAFNSLGYSDWSPVKCTQVGSSPTITPTPTNTRLPIALDPPMLSDITNPDGGSTFSVEWMIVSGAEWYKVKENHSATTWEPVYEGPETILQRTNLDKGDYCYRVRAFSANVYSEWSDVICTTVGGPMETPMPTPSITPTPDMTPMPTGEVTPPVPHLDHALYVPLVRAAD